jgi:hypothetical protein
MKMLDLRPQQVRCDRLLAKPLIDIDEDVNDEYGSEIRQLPDNCRSGRI